MARQFASVHKHSLLLFLLVCYGHDTLAYSPSVPTTCKWKHATTFFVFESAAHPCPGLCSPLLASESSDTHCTIPSLLSFSVASLRGAPPTSLLVSTLTIAEHLPLFSLPLFPPSFLSRPCGQREFVTLRATDQLVTLSWLFFLLRRRARLSFDERTVDFFAALSTGHDQFPRKIFKVG